MLFPTITFPRVKGLFRKIGFPEQIATVLALICTEAPREEIEHQGQLYHVALGPRCLPQGAPTSPAITNIICLRLDRRISGLARKFHWKYTRYADDMTFSHQGEQRPTIGSLFRFLPKIIKEEGFQLNHRKTRILRQGNRQKVTGLVVNRLPEAPTHPRVPRKLCRQLRSAIHQRLQGKQGKHGETLSQLRGMVAFVYMADPEKGRKFMQQLDQIEKLQQQDTSEE